MTQGYEEELRSERDHVAGLYARLDAERARVKAEYEAALGGWARPLLEQVGERAPLDQLHDDERPAVAERADLVDRRDARVLELAGDARLVEETVCRG